MMSFLIFCSAEIGGLPFKIAEVLNNQGVETYYISLSGRIGGHDSSFFHYGSNNENWNLTRLFADLSRFSHKIDQVIYSRRKIVERLNEIKERFGITYCFASGIKSFLLKDAGIDYHYWSYGSDLDRHCFQPVFPPNYPMLIKYLLLVPFKLIIRPNARKSILRSDAVMIAPYQGDKLSQICPDKKLFFLPHLIDISDYSELQKTKENNREKLCNKLSVDHFFFSATRHEWAGPFRNEPDSKGNDIIIKSYAKYLAKAKRTDSKLVLVEKGSDVHFSKTLAKDLNINESIYWVKEMKRADLQQYYQGAKLCFGQFNNPVITYAALEPLANGTGAASFFGENKNNIPFYEELPPLLNSKDPNVIANFMHDVVNNNDLQRNICHKSWKWTMTHCSDKKFVKSFKRLF